ncbi:MAG: hypothetical protein QME12_04680 [Nanoarchaeota archaeon]|nr:hypothetical protein [Nanoarchaeota archaeon]
MQINAKKILGIGESKDDFKEAVKASFSKVKEHISSVEGGIKLNKEQILAQKAALESLKSEVLKAKEGLNSQKEPILRLESTINSQKELISSQKSKFESDLEGIKSSFLSQNEKISTFSDKIDIILKRLGEIEAKMSVSTSSTGNEGVYSDIHSFNIHSFTRQEKPASGDISSELSLEPKQRVEKPDLAILSSSRQDILGRFSGLSKQELRTFLTVYGLEEEKGNVSYLDVAKKLNLTEGCIRTYVSSLMKSGIPVEKVKLNNKMVVLHIPKEFKELSMKAELVSIYYDTAQPTQRKLGHF